MRSDVVIVGAELDGLIAALVLAEAGHRVRLIARGAGSLHYATGGIHLLGYAGSAAVEAIADPLAAIDDLDQRHPYRRIGSQSVQQALDWYLSGANDDGPAYRTNGGNALAVTPAGLAMPSFAWSSHQAVFDDLKGKQVSIVDFAGHQDLPVGLLRAALTRRNIEAEIISVEGPSARFESLGLAREFDDLSEPEAYFGRLKSRLPPASEVVLFPAVLGLARHRDVLHAAEQALGVRCLEIPTLPPSVPGLRLHRHLMGILRRKGVALHLGARLRGTASSGARVEAVYDEGNRDYRAAAFILASGGVLMGGLEVGSTGTVTEPNFGLAVYQTDPLAVGAVDPTLDALHETGVETDLQLRPLAMNEPQFENLFVTGTTLAHWHPTREASSEGVAIATGWRAAQEVCKMLEV